MKTNLLLTIECKINPDRFNPESLSVFRELYPQGRNYLVCPGVREPCDRRAGKLILRVAGCRDLLRELERAYKKRQPR